MKITLSQIKCHLITIYCFILMIQSYYNINNAKTLRYINVCIWSTYEGRSTLYCAFKSCISCIFTVDSRILIRILCTRIRIRIRIHWKLEWIRIRILAKWSDSDSDSNPLLPDLTHLWNWVAASSPHSVVVVVCPQCERGMSWLQFSDHWSSSSTTCGWSRWNAYFCSHCKFCYTTTLAACRIFYLPYF